MLTPQTSSIQIGAHKIGEDHPPYIIAEMSGNHNQSLDRALQIVDAAAKAGTHAIKLQTYTADTMTIDVKTGDFFIDDPNSLWHGHSLHDLYKIAHTPWEWHEPILKHCQKLGITCFSTPFDLTAVDFLEKLNMPAYKVASFENGDLALIERVAKTGKPVIISTGMASVSVIQDAVETARKAGCTELILMKCTSSYPASPALSNLRTIPNLRELFKTQVGLSDHTLGIGVPIASVAFGATVIEKHFTISRKEGGVDAAFSLEPQELKALVEETHRAWQALGTVSYEMTETERASTIFRRSLYITENIQSGTKLTPNNLKAIRPGKGLPPKYLPQLLGKTVNQTLARGTAMAWEYLT